MDFSSLVQTASSGHGAAPVQAPVPAPGPRAHPPRLFTEERGRSRGFSARGEDYMEDYACISKSVLESLAGRHQEPRRCSPVTTARPLASLPYACSGTFSRRLVRMLSFDFGLEKSIEIYHCLIPLTNLMTRCTLFHLLFNRETVHVPV